MLSDRITKDISRHTLVKSGAFGMWTFRLYRDLYIEAWGTKTFEASSGVSTVVLPYSMSSKSYHVGATPSRNCTVVSKYAVIDESGNDGRHYGEFQFYRELSSNYTTDFTFEIKGYVALLP